MDVFAVLIVGMVVAAAVAVGVQTLLKNKRLRVTRDITDAATAYFAKSGVKVTVLCLARPDGKLVALIESEPLKQFRYSYVIEQSLIDYIRKNYDVQIEQAFWRFPLQPKEGGAQASRANVADAAPAAQPTATESRSPAPALAGTKVEEHYKVDEISWENYENALQPGAKPEENSTP